MVNLPMTSHSLLGKDEVARPASYGQFGTQGREGTQPCSNGFPNWAVLGNPNEWKKTLENP